MSQIQQIDFSVNLLKAILWQYNSAEKLQSILQSKQDWYTTNQKLFWDNWFSDVFNLQTANEFGLSVWAIILQLPIVVESTPPTASRPAWGFEEFRRNFDRGNFYTDKAGSIVLTPENARIALRLRYYQLTIRPTVTQINKVLSEVFADYGPVYVEDNLDMTITYKIGFVPNGALMNLVTSFDLFLRPSGVDATYELF